MRCGLMKYHWNPLLWRKQQTHITNVLMPGSEISAPPLIGKRSNINPRCYFLVSVFSVSLKQAWRTERCRHTVVANWKRAPHATQAFLADFQQEVLKLLRSLITYTQKTQPPQYSYVISTSIKFCMGRGQGSNWRRERSVEAHETWWFP
jgi:hypothetical protein